MKSKVLVIFAMLGAIVLLLSIAACSQTPVAQQSVPGAQGPAGPAGPPGPAGKPAPVPPGPGLKMEITKVEIPADNKPVVTFKLTDDKGNPVSPADLDANSLRFAIDKLVTDKATGLTSFENYIVTEVKGAAFTLNGAQVQPALATAKQAVQDFGGKLTQTDTGFTYVFTNTLPANIDKTATHVIGGQATRNTREFVANAVYSYVPTGGAPARREVVSTQACNQCHDPVAAHGGQRVETQVCVLCHTAQTIDPESGNTVDFKVMVHKLHNGSKLPSVAAGKKPYYIVGYRQTVADLSGSAWPQDVRNCTTCHQKGTQADNWKTAPSRAACGACHDGIDWETGKAKYAGGRNHSDVGPQKNDEDCKTCHVADSGKEFDESIVGAHVIPNASKQLRGVKFAIVGVSDTKPGQKPTVTFNIKDQAGKTIDPKDFSSLSLVLAGPTTDYAKMWSESLVISATISTKAKDAGSGNYTYTFDNAIPADAKGSYAVSMQGYINTQLKRADGKPVLGTDNKTPLVVRDVGFNPVFYFGVTDAKAVARRGVVDRESCNKCHKDIGNPAGLSIHGGSRMNTEFCVFCHNANNTDEARRPADKGTPESIEFDYLIHSIHKGEERGTPFTVYGFGNNPVDFSEVVYPGNLANCAKCHPQGANLLPLKKTLPQTVTQKGAVVSVTQPVTVVCSGCHATVSAKAHFALNTSNDKTEACAVCHGEGREFAVSKHK
ncbi:MAG: OmcA/MtrC family decaheme c-type cytochrome [Chloroflexi bacterium]|nr:OmcA/MtrC family decaheme c-type cytochrome [Chloroflexota bacterium]